MRKTDVRCAVPVALRIDDALDGHAMLVSLRMRLRDSAARLHTLRPHLPGHLAAHVQAGPLDAEGWSLIAGNAAVAAKLRQLLPRLEQVLQTAGWQPHTIRIKTASPSTV